MIRRKHLCFLLAVLCFTAHSSAVCVGDEDQNLDRCEDGFEVGPYFPCYGRRYPATQLSGHFSNGWKTSEGCAFECNQRDDCEMYSFQFQDERADKVGHCVLFSHSAMTSGEVVEWGYYGSLKCVKQDSGRRRVQVNGLGVFAVGDSVLVDSQEQACISSIVDASKGMVEINYADGITVGEPISVGSLTLVEAGVGCAEVKICANWFGNNLDWSTIPFEQVGNTDWGLTPNGCTRIDVLPHGEYWCGVYDKGSFTDCEGDCFHGRCVTSRRKLSGQSSRLLL